MALRSCSLRFPRCRPQALGQRFASGNASPTIPAGGSAEVIVQQHALTPKDVSRLERLRNVGISAHIECVLAAFKSCCEPFCEAKTNSSQKKFRACARWSQPLT